MKLRSDCEKRISTVGSALVLCLNIGIDPPDQAKHAPYARAQCWFDPLSCTSMEALKIIGNRLQSQYQFWQPRSRYRQLLDPNVSQIQQQLTSLRRIAQRNRVLMHYNGQGVPRPSKNGEIWCFNKDYTKYIPVSLYEIQTWMGMEDDAEDDVIYMPLPSLYILDCSNAGRVVDNFRRFLQKRRRRKRRSPSFAGATKSKKLENIPDSLLFGDALFLGACSSEETLSSNPDFPADLFSSCLLTPVRTSLRWCRRRRRRRPHIYIYIYIYIYIWRANQRDTLHGELNWALTSITDAIAFDLLPADTFTKLYRQVLLPTMN
eukprot:jgi/Bigna1/39237/e_gw1.31.58.1